MIKNIIIAMLILAIITICVYSLKRSRKQQTQIRKLQDRLEQMRKIEKIEDSPLLYRKRTISM